MPRKAKAEQSQTEGKPKMGRPTKYTPELRNRICAWVADGNSLRSAARQDWCVHMDTLQDWLTKHTDFSVQYARACQERAHALAEETLEIADDTSEDFVPDKEGNLKVNNEAIQRARLRVDTRKWFASKLFPKVYGEKVQQEVTGADGGAIQIERKPMINWALLSPEAREAAKMVLLEAKALQEGTIINQGEDE